MRQIGFVCNMKIGPSISDKDTMKIHLRTPVVTPRRAFNLALLCGLINLGTAQFAHAQDTKPLANKKFRLVVPFSPGGGVDGLARAVAENLTRNAGAALTTVLAEAVLGCPSFVKICTVFNKVVPTSTELVSTSSCKQPPLAASHTSPRP